MPVGQQPHGLVMFMLIYSKCQLTALTIIKRIFRIWVRGYGKHVQGFCHILFSFVLRRSFPFSLERYNFCRTEFLLKKNTQHIHI
jgi:hypothetical protein